jgi:hypothetical protein
MRFVSLMVGANDLFRLQDSCAASADVPSCILTGLPALLTTDAGNLTTIYTNLRGAGFTGEFVAVTYYSLDYADPLTTGAIGALDQVLASVTQAFGGRVADGFGAFATAAAASGGSSCAAGLLIHLSATTCDVHPSPAGAALLAGALHDAEAS